MTIAENIFLGVLSGVITAAFLFGLGQLFSKAVIPWYLSLIYKGLDVSGRWFESHDYEGVLLQESVINIKQTAHKIMGEIILAKKNSTTGKEVEVKSFKFSGDFYNNFLNITCWNSDQRQIGTHNYLMSVKMDGREMKGMKTYFDIGMQKIRSEEIYWMRKENN